MAGGCGACDAMAPVQQAPVALPSDQMVVPVAASPLQVEQYAPAQVGAAQLAAAAPISTAPPMAQAATGSMAGMRMDTTPVAQVVANASPSDRAKADALRRATIAGTTQYRDINAAMAAGYRFKARDLADTRSRFVHVTLKGSANDGVALDPSRPESLMYRRNDNGTFSLVGVMYVADTNMADVGSIPRWHQHGASAASKKMTHVWLTDDLTSSFARKPPTAAIQRYLDGKGAAQPLLDPANAVQP